MIVMPSLLSWAVLVVAIVPITWFVLPMFFWKQFQIPLFKDTPGYSALWAAIVHMIPI